MGTPYFLKNHIFFLILIFLSLKCRILYRKFLGYFFHNKVDYVFLGAWNFKKEIFNKERKFIKIEGKNLPFKDKEFDFVIASHVIEHVEDFEFFLKELERISTKGYIELPTRLGDNLVFENKTDHLWHMDFDDVNNKLIITKKNQIFFYFSGPYHRLFFLQCDVFARFVDKYPY